MDRVRFPAGFFQSETKLQSGDFEMCAGLQPQSADAPAFVDGSVFRSQVQQCPLRVHHLDHGMMDRNPGVIEHNEIVLSAADGDRHLAEIVFDFGAIRMCHF